MRQRDQESVTDPHEQDLFFDPADDGLLPHDDLLAPLDTAEHGFYDHPQTAPPVGSGGRHSADGGGRNLRHDRGRRRRVFGVLALVLVVLVAAVGYFVALPIYRYFSPNDYSGSGSGQVVVTVQADDSAGQIADTLVHAGVVASSKAFTVAAENNPRSGNIQPGSYRLHRHMSAASALTLLLTPSARVDADVTVYEGATVLDVESRLTAAPCTASSPSGTVCGLGLSRAAVLAALKNVGALGLPTDFTVAGKAPSSAEGFLYPATYPFDDSTTATVALSQMVSRFTDQARDTSFTDQAKALHLTPYQELIVASIAQAEAKFSTDMPRVARVILNRLAAGQNLKVDATSAYAAKLAGKNPAKTIYADEPGPYNTYTHSGLPPTPISNPGASALNAAAHPAVGPWLFYVNGDAAGHLVFATTEQQFEAARQKCVANKWGCG